MQATDYSCILKVMHPDRCPDCLGNKEECGKEAVYIMTLETSHHLTAPQDARVSPRTLLRLVSSPA